MIKNYCNETKQTAQWWSEARTQVSTQSDKSLRCPHEENVSLAIQNAPVKILIRLRESHPKTISMIMQSQVFKFSV